MHIYVFAGCQFGFGLVFICVRSNVSKFDLKFGLGPYSSHKIKFSNKLGLGL